MKMLTISALMLTMLACGMVAVIPVYTPATAAKTPITPPVIGMTYNSQSITGCWNLRATAGGADIGEICDRRIIVASDHDGGWYYVPGKDAWICGRAFGAEVKCKTR